MGEGAFVIGLSQVLSFFSFVKTHVQGISPLNYHIWPEIGTNLSTESTERRVYDKIHVSMNYTSDRKRKGKKWREYHLSILLASSKT